MLGMRSVCTMYPDIIPFHSTTFGGFQDKLIDVEEMTCIIISEGGAVGSI